MFSNVIVGWIARLGLEVGGLLGALLIAWNNLPPVTQEAILAISYRSDSSLAKRATRRELRRSCLHDKDHAMNTARPSA
jgi:hypothetical protein